MSDGIDQPLNFNWITNRLILGSRPRNDADIQTLLKLSVSHVLNVCETADPPWPFSVQYLWNPTADDGKSKSLMWFQTILRFAMPVFSQSGWIFYFHCFNGIDRSGIATYTVMRAFGLSHVQAWFLIKERRPQALWLYEPDAETALVKGW